MPVQTERSLLARSKPAAPAAEGGPDPARFAVLTLAVDEIETLRLGDPHRRALFRAAGAELGLDTPPKVAITEFVDVARAFFPEGREPRLVNAVLDAMAREARPEAFR